MTTTQDRWKAAIKDIRSDGVKVRQNVRKCCRGCITESDLGLPQGSLSPSAYTYGGQDCQLLWRDSEPFQLDRRGWRKGPEVPASVVYWNHDNGAGSRVADRFRQHGFRVEWDGTEMQCVIIHLGE